MQNTATAAMVLLGTPNSDGTWTGVTAGTSIPVVAKNHTLPTITVIGNGTISGGTVIIEEAYWGATQMPYSGTWSTIQSLTLPGSPTISGNAQLVVHLPPSSYHARRVRVASVTGGGGISAVLTEN